MISITFENRRRDKKTMAVYARIALVAALVAAGSVSVYREAVAGCAAAAAVADAGLNACSSNRGKALYDCIANVLDRLNGDISRDKVPSTQSALQTAASKLRAAVNKVQALSAITQCRALVVAAMDQLRAIGARGVGLDAIVAVLGHAAKLIQSKG
jgi:hypothetical protein